jgi:hypothetical protein
MAPRDSERLCRKGIGGAFRGKLIRGVPHVLASPDDPTLAHCEWFRLPPAKKEFRGILPRSWVGKRTFSWVA